MRNSQKLKKKLVENNFQGNINKALMDFFNLYGYNNSLNTNLYKYLTDRGYSGQLSEKLTKWEKEGFGLEPVTSLFINNEVGVWYDPSDLNTLWQDTAGTIPVTTSGQMVARIDDKSGNGYHATQETEDSRPLYQTDGLLHWLEFDGINDHLSTAIITPGTDKAQVFAGIRRLAVGASSDIVGIGIGGLNSFVLRNSEGTGVNFVLRSRGDGSYGVSYFVEGSQFTGVLTGIMDIATDKTLLSINGVDGNEVVADQGLGNFAANYINIGARGIASFPFTGYIYNLVVRFGPNLNNSIITNQEKYLARKIGVSF